MLEYAQHQRAIDRGADCEHCPLYGCQRGPVMGQIVPGAKLAIVGEAPGNNEVDDGRPFTGASGAVLDNAMRTQGLERAQLTITNAILCQPPTDFQDYLADLRYRHKMAEKRDATLTPLILPQTACYPRLARDLDESGSRTLLAVGGEGLKGIARYANVPYASALAAPGAPHLAKIGRQHGAPLPLPDGRVIAASLHPAFAMRPDSRTFMPVVKADLERAARIAVRGHIDWTEPDYILNPSYETVISTIEQLRASGALVTVDIETTRGPVRTVRIHCVGLGATIDGKEVVTVIPLRAQNGNAWWGAEQEDRIRDALRRLMDEAPLGGQNLAFDTSVLLHNVLMTVRTKCWMDSMLMHHVGPHSELPHDLGFILARFFEAPRHKDDADAKSFEAPSDADLHKYCAKDVLTEMRLLSTVYREHVVAYDCETAFKTDTKIAPRARDMGDLGLVMNDAVRYDLYGRLTEKLTGRTAALRAAVGRDDFNPRSTDQVAQWLYSTQGYTPPFATDGKPWVMPDLEGLIDTETTTEEREELRLDGASTDEASLLALLARGVDPTTRQFIDALFEVRALDKIRGTYIGLKEIDGELIDAHRRAKKIIDETWDGFPTLPVLHTTYKTHVIPTGRMSTQPAVQNWPERMVYDPELYRRTRDGEKPQGILNTRSMVIAPPGHKIIGADYSSIELRLYTVLAQDVALLDAYARGLDAHSWNYASMMGRSPVEVQAWYKKVEGAQKDQRKYARIIAKRFVFLLIYGGQLGKLYATMKNDRNPDGSLSFPDLQESMVRRWFSNFLQQHPEMQRWQRRVLDAFDYEQHRGGVGYIATIIDQRKRFFIGGVDANAMINHGVQGGAAAIANQAFLRITDEIPHRGWSKLSGINLQIHDFIGGYVPDARVEQAKEIFLRCMPFKYEGMDFPVELKVGDSWADV